MRNINWIAYRMLPFDGYGRYSRHMIRNLALNGVGVRPGMVADMSDMPGWMLHLAGYNFNNLTIQCMPAHEFVPLPGRVWGYTMTEDDSIPADWARTINQVCERLIVPCEHNADVMKRRGVTVPVHVVHGGTDPGEFPIRPWVNLDRPYTFMALGDRPPRKGTEEAWAAFYQAFGDEKQTPDVRLVIKIRPEFMPWMATSALTDKRVTIWREQSPSMADVFGQVDCFVFPSAGEGWGMPPREAAMMGLPVIATRWSGLEVEIDNWAIPLDSITMAESSLAHKRPNLWAKADVGEVAEKMRWCYDNRSAAAAKGLQAASWLRANQTWDHSARELIALMEKHG